MKYQSMNDPFVKCLLTDGFGGGVHFPMTATGEWLKLNNCVKCRAAFNLGFPQRRLTTAQWNKHAKS